MKKRVLSFVVIATLIIAQVLGGGMTIFAAEYADTFGGDDVDWTSGANVVLNANWRTKTVDEGNMGTNNNGQVKLAGNGVYLTTVATRSDNYTCRSNAADDPAMSGVVYVGDHSELSDAQSINFKVTKQHKTDAFGIRFMVHNGGKSYYEIIFGGYTTKPHDGGSNCVRYGIYKMDNGTSTVLKEVFSPAIAGDAGSNNISEYGPASISITYNNGEIAFDCVQTSFSGTEELQNFSDTCTDSSNPFLLSGNDATVMFVTHGVRTDYATDRYVKFYDFSISDLVASGELIENNLVYDDGSLVYTYTKTTHADSSEEVSNVAVTGLSESNANATSVVIPDKVTIIDGVESYVSSIAASAFRGKGISKVTFNTTKLTTIGDSAFRGCQSLGNVTIPEGVKSIESSAFKGTYKIATIVIPSTIESIGTEAFRFSGNDTLTVTIKADNIAIVNSIVFTTGGSNTTDSYIFNVKNQAMADHIRTVYAGFSNLTVNIGFVDIRNGNNGIFAYEYSVLDNGSSEEYGDLVITGFAEGYAVPEKLIIPDTITINDTAVYVNGIGDGAFASQKAIKQIVFECTNLESIGVGAFQGIDYIPEIVIPDGVTSIGANAFRSCWCLSYVEIPSSVTKIYNGTFFYTGKDLCVVIKGSSLQTSDIANTYKPVFSTNDGTVITFYTTDTDVKSVIEGINPNDDVILLQSGTFMNLSRRILFVPSEDITACLIIADYTNNRMNLNNFNLFNVVGKENKISTIGIPNDYYNSKENGNSIKAFIFNSITDCMPLANALEI